MIASTGAMGSLDVASGRRQKAHGKSKQTNLHFHPSKHTNIPPSLGLCLSVIQNVHQLDVRVLVKRADIVDSKELKSQHAPSACTCGLGFFWNRLCCSAGSSSCRLAWISGSYCTLYRA